jgi:phenylacetic acid degradation operon negative regulatory protein
MPPAPATPSLSRREEALPRELLPARWSGVKAARLFADRHEQWSADARREWTRLNN